MFLYYQGNAIVSGSRDDTARLWRKSSTTKWDPSTVFEGHTRYVSAVAYREPDEQFSQVFINKLIKRHSSF